MGRCIYFVVALALAAASTADAFQPVAMGRLGGLVGKSTGTAVSAATVDAEYEYASSCYLPTDWMSLNLLSKTEYNHDSTIYEFELPRCTSLNLPACGCILLNAPGAEKDGTDAVRPYTPISDNGMLGKFQLIVKRYDGGAVSQYLHNLKIGSPVQFKHISFNIKRQYPFEGAKTISLLCAGTGIAPIYQALLRLMNTPGDDRKVTLVYGNKSIKDILLKDELDAWAKRYPDRLKIIHVVGETADQAAPDGWKDTDTYIAENGWIDAEKIKKYCFSPADDTAIFVCGLPVMYDMWCGPRGEAELAKDTVLDKLGYTTSMVAKM